MIVQRSVKRQIKTSRVRDETRWQMEETAATAAAANKDELILCGNFSLLMKWKSNTHHDHTRPSSHTHTHITQYGKRTVRVRREMCLSELKTMSAATTATATKMNAFIWYNKFLLLRLSRSLFSTSIYHSSDTQLCNVANANGKMELFRTHRCRSFLFFDFLFFVIIFVFFRRRLHFVSAFSAARGWGSLRLLLLLFYYYFYYYFVSFRLHFINTRFCSVCFNTFCCCCSARFFFLIRCCNWNAIVYSFVSFARIFKAKNICFPMKIDYSQSTFIAPKIRYDDTKVYPKFSSSLNEHYYCYYCDKYWLLACVLALLQFVCL